MKERFLSKLLESHPDSVASSSCLDPSLIKFPADLGCSHKSGSVFTGDECGRFTSPSPFRSGSLQLHVFHPPPPSTFSPPSACRFWLHRR